MTQPGGVDSPERQGGFFPVVYDELKRLAAARLASERSGHSLNPTALVHEAYLRLGEARFADRSGFFRAAAVAMQRILVDHARRHKATRRGGGARTIALDGNCPALGADPDLILDVDAALERLAQEDPSSAEVARHRLFAGLSIDQTAEALGLSRATAFREWAYARSWLATALGPDDDHRQ
jgi:RNA polymerase sigma factor (TIGR02999 family)